MNIPMTESIVVVSALSLSNAGTKSWNSSCPDSRRGHASSRLQVPLHVSHGRAIDIFVGKKFRQDVSGTVQTYDSRPLRGRITTWANPRHDEITVTWHL